MVYPKKKPKHEGDTCPHCNTPVEKKEPDRKRLKEGQSYYFEYYL